MEPSSSKPMYFPPKKEYMYKMKQMESAKSPPQEEPADASSPGEFYGKNGKKELGSPASDQGENTASGRLRTCPRGGRGEKKLAFQHSYIQDEESNALEPEVVRGAADFSTGRGGKKLSLPHSYIQDEESSTLEPEVVRGETDFSRPEEQQPKEGTQNPNPYEYDQDVEQRIGKVNKRLGTGHGRETGAKKACASRYSHGKDMRALMATQPLYLEQANFESPTKSFEGERDPQTHGSKEHPSPTRKRKSEQSGSRDKEFIPSQPVHQPQQHRQLNPHHPHSKSQPISSSQLHSGTGRPRGRPRKDQSERRVHRQPSLSGMCDEITSSIDNTGLSGSRHRTSSLGGEVDTQACIKMEADSERPYASSSTSNVAKLSEQQICQVCGDIAAGFHCGAYVCEACKKFFVRCLKQDVGEKFMCSRDKMCTINKETRTQCQCCRYQKCLSLGMYKPGSGPGGGKFGAEISHIPCKVCESPSSGYHFGAITCEGCKGFFRRTVKERAGVRYVCSRNGNCNITVNTRNVCKACRYQKCLQAGMTPDGSRIGRQPNAVKHATMLELQRLATHGYAEVKKEVLSPPSSQLASPETNQDLTLPENAQFEMIDPSNFPEDLYTTLGEESKMKAQVEHLSQGGGDLQEVFLPKAESDHLFHGQTPQPEPHIQERPLELNRYSNSYYSDSQSGQHALPYQSEHSPTRSKEPQETHMPKERQEREQLRLPNYCQISTSEREHPKQTVKQQDKPQHPEQQRLHRQQQERQLAYEQAVANRGEAIPRLPASVDNTSGNDAPNEMQALHSQMDIQQARIEVLNAQHQELRRQEQLKAMELRAEQDKLEHHSEFMRKLSAQKAMRSEQFAMQQQLEQLNHQQQLNQHKQHILQQQLQQQQIQQQQQQLQQLQQQQLQHQKLQHQQLQKQQQSPETSTQPLREMPEVHPLRRLSYTETSPIDTRLQPQRVPLSREQEYSVNRDLSRSFAIGRRGSYTEVDHAVPQRKDFDHGPSIPKPRVSGPQPLVQRSTSSSSAVSYTPPSRYPSESSQIETATDLRTTDIPREERARAKSCAETVEYLPSPMKSLTEKVTQASLHLRPVLKKSDCTLKIERGTSTLQMWEAMMAQFGQCAPSVIKFARRVPGFQKFPVAVQISKVQMSMYPIVLTVLSTQYNMETKAYNYFHMSAEERDIIFEYFTGFKILQDHFLRIGHSVKYKDLDDIEIAFLCAIILMTSYAPGEEDKSTLPEVEADLIAALQHYCAQKDKSDTGRDAYIMARVAELNRCNVEHQRAVFQLKMEHDELEFPQLYAETYLSM